MGRDVGVPETGRGAIGEGVSESEERVEINKKSHGPLSTRALHSTRVHRVHAHANPERLCIDRTSRGRARTYAPVYRLCATIVFFFAYSIKRRDYAIRLSELLKVGIEFLSRVFVFGIYFKSIRFKKIPAQYSLHF